ncbi:MAG: efflux RND transporter periplasmic adaptor subunit [bacterium]|nr:efflux RND transporter periplasmic adaptor subunit [bacterium]
MGSYGKWMTFFLAAAVSLLAVAGLTGCSESEALTEIGNGTGAEAVAPVSVIATPVQRRTFEERVAVQGTLEAKTFALVSPQVPGRVEQVYVKEGDSVVAGETKLFRVDGVKLARAVEVSQQDLAMSQCARASAQAQIEQAEANRHKAKLDIDRFTRLLKEGAVTADAKEQHEANHKQSAAAVKYAQAVERQTAEQERQARAALAIAEKDLSDALVVAPVNGQVSCQVREVGEFAGVGEPVIRIEDPSLLEVSAFLPAQYYPRVAVGETNVRLTTYGVDLGEASVAYKSPTINPKLRTFEVKCVLEHPPSPAVPGAMVELAVVLDQRETMGVPEAALQTRQGVHVVFIADDARARMVEVQPGIRTDGWTEIATPELDDATLVVTQGQYMLEQGAPIAVSRED